MPATTGNSSPRPGLGSGKLGTPSVRMHRANASAVEALRACRFYATGGFRPVSRLGSRGGMCAVAGETAVQPGRGATSQSSMAMTCARSSSLRAAAAEC
jgi:hypothetical protein